MVNYNLITIKDKLANGFNLDEGFTSAKRYATPVNKHPAKTLIYLYAGAIIKKFRDTRNKVLMALYREKRRHEAYRFSEDFKSSVKADTGQIAIDLSPMIASFIKKAYATGVIQTEKHSYTKIYPNTQEMHKAIEKSKTVKKIIKQNKVSIKKYSVNVLEKKTKDLLDKGLEEGKTIEQIGNEISKLYNASAWKGIQIAQTELNRAHTYAAKDVIKKSMKKTKSRHYWWNINPAASKTGTCKLCMKMYRWCKRLKGFSVMNKSHPLPVDDTHNHCFCFITPYFKK